MEFTDLDCFAEPNIPVKLNGKLHPITDLNMQQYIEVLKKETEKSFKDDADYIRFLANFMCPTIDYDKLPEVPRDKFGATILATFLKKNENYSKLLKQMQENHKIMKQVLK